MQTRQSNELKTQQWKALLPDLNIHIDYKSFSFGVGDKATADKKYNYYYVRALGIMDG